MGPHGNGTAARKRLRTCRKKRRRHENVNSAIMRSLARHQESRMPNNYFYHIFQRTSIYLVNYFPHNYYLELNINCAFMKCRFSIPRV